VHCCAFNGCDQDNSGDYAATDQRHTYILGSYRLTHEDSRSCDDRGVYYGREPSRRSQRRRNNGVRLQARHPQTIVAYPDSVEYLYSLGNEVKSLKFGLEGIIKLLGALENPQQSFPSVHAAGTNGKGSTCAMIESGLRASGLRTGLYTSPHLVEPTERIRITGESVSKADFARAFDVVHGRAEQLVRDKRLEHHTTYFETVTAMAFVLFRDAGIEIAVIETGLGGRLDATNVVMPDLSVITPIDFDHETFLGSSIESIAGEKAGILKPGVPAVIACQRDDALRVLTRRAREVGAPLTDVPPPEKVSLDQRGSNLVVNGLTVRCPLAGAHQVQNAATAVLALMALSVPSDAIQRGIANTAWPGRLEYVSEVPKIVLDGAHNPAGARALADYIRTFCLGREVWIVYGAMRDKSVQEITEILFPLASHVILTAPSQPRAVRPDALINACDHSSVEIASSVGNAVERARSAPPGAIVFITGSLYLVGEARPLFVK
jgi:dihydrofolate synthase / folylpolyglutamate synthase